MPRHLLPLAVLAALVLVACDESTSNPSDPTGQGNQPGFGDSARATPTSILGRWALDTTVNVFGGLRIQDTLTFESNGAGRVDGWHDGYYHDIETWNWSIAGDTLVRVTTACWEGVTDGEVTKVDCDGIEKGLVYHKHGSLHIQTYEGRWWDFRYRRL